MKIVRNIYPFIMAVSLALAVAGFVSVPTSAQAQQKGAEQLIQLKSINTVEALKSLDVGDTVVMSCPKCKESYATVVEKTFKAVKPEELKQMTIHLCSACETKVVTKGQGKLATEKLVHTCKACGSKDVSCCVMKKGGSPTPGVEEKK